MENKCKSGWLLNREQFSGAAILLLYGHLDYRRHAVALPYDAVKGHRFNDDVDTLARLESMFSETQFMACPGARIDAALLDAARADWWYSQEKSYDDDERSNETEIADEDE